MTDSQILRIVGKNVKAARIKANLTQECLAELVGVHWQTIIYIEGGRTLFSIPTLARLGQALETTPNRLFEGLPEPDKERMQQIKNAMARKRRPKRERKADKNQKE